MSANMISLQIALELYAAVFTICCAFITCISRRDEPQRSLYILILLILGAVLVLSDAAAWWVYGGSGSAAYWIMRIANFMVYLSYPLMFIFVSRYFYRLTQFHGKDVSLRWLYIMDGICYVHILLIVVTPFTGLLYYFDENNVYHRSSSYPIIAILGVIELIYLAVLILYNMQCLSRYEMVALLAFVLVPFVTNLIQLFHYGLSLTELSSDLCMVLFFMFHEVEKSTRLLGQSKLLATQEEALSIKENDLAERMKDLAQQQQQLSEKEKALNFALAVNEYYKTQLTQKERELTQANVNLSISQMKPHFIFNALGSIEQLCHTSPQIAAEATHQFASYLRTNLTAMNNRELKDFQEELAHIHAYVWLEQMRFGEDLSYEEDIQADDFQVPVLSVQPLIENAIKHGMMGSEDGILHVRLKTWEDAESYYIQVSDDGGGFDINHLPDDGKAHIGLANVRTHIQHMCNGKLLMESTIGVGSVFTIVIPK